MNKWLISDTHFFHENIIKWECFRTEFSNVEFMNEFIIQQWNDTVNPADTVYHLGDFALGTNMEAIENLIKRLNGKIHLILGNHDTPRKVKLYAQLLPFVSGCVVLPGKRCCLTHFPVMLDESEAHAMYSRVNIHGHIHEKEKCPNDAQHIGIAWDLERKIYNLDELV
ncbi:MAG: metallophosphoesterase family protein [Bacteroidales bacterium]|jgi:calcineurin-like phosphoesterase family protein|nr:metallophosphoesterase family protein [Bacteroidales bacterium]